MPEPCSLVTWWLMVGQASHPAASGTAEHPEGASYSWLSAKGGTELAWASDGPEPQGQRGRSSPSGAALGTPPATVALLISWPHWAKP